MTRTLTRVNKKDSFGASLRTEEPEASEFFRFVVETSAMKTRADYVALLIKEGGSGEFVAKAEQGAPNSRWNKICPLMLTKNGAVRFDERTPCPPKLRQMMTESGVSALLCLPLEIDGQVVGALNHIKRISGASFSLGDERFACMLTQKVGTEMENTRLRHAWKTGNHMEELLIELHQKQESELQRMATELHGGVAQWLVGATYGIEECRSLITDARYDELDAALARIKDTVRASTAELRRVIANSRPQALAQLGLPGAIRRSIDVLVRDGIECRFDILGTPLHLGESEESTLYWAAEEMITNIRKHARAGRVDMELRYSAGSVSITATDDGIGFDSRTIAKGCDAAVRMGLTGMRERVELLGGSMDIDSCLGSGTTVVVTLPAVS